MVAAVQALGAASAVHARIPRLARVHHVVWAHMLLCRHRIACGIDVRHLHAHDITFANGRNRRRIAKYSPALQLVDLLANDLHVTQVAITQRSGAHRLNTQCADGVQRAGMRIQCDVLFAVVVACAILARSAHACGRPRSHSVRHKNVDHRLVGLHVE